MRIIRRFNFMSIKKFKNGQNFSNPCYLQLNDISLDTTSGESKCNGLIRSTIKFVHETWKIKINLLMSHFFRKNIMDKVDFTNIENLTILSMCHIVK